MGKKTGISWSDSTWNPATGCTKISLGCDHCYAETYAIKLRDQQVPKYINGFDLTTHPSALVLPLRWTKPRHIFVNSMSDLHHKDMPVEFLHQVYEVMVKADWHRFQVLTKRSSLMRDYIKENFDGKQRSLPEHIWLGVSVENANAKSRIDHLRQINCAIKFLSIEPLLEDVGVLNLENIQWVIVGCESGQGARPMSLDWVRSIRDQCQAAKVPFFFKQAEVDGQIEENPALDGKQWLEFPSLPSKQKTLF